MSGSDVPCRAQAGGVQPLLDCSQTVRIRRRIGDLDFAAFDGKSFGFSGGIADNVHRPPFSSGQFAGNACLHSKQQSFMLFRKAVEWLLKNPAVGFRPDRTIPQRD